MRTQFAEFQPFVSQAADWRRFTPGQMRPIETFAVVWQLPLTHVSTVDELLKSTYAEPTVIWRLRNSDDGRRAYSVIVPHGSRATAGWFSQGIPQELRSFATWHDAIGWVEGKLVTLQLHGWHVEAPDDRVAAPPRRTPR